MLADTPIALSPEIEAVLARRGAIVALESSVIANGLPFPANREAAERMEHAVRECGATPAIIGVIDGTIVVGASDERLDRLTAGGVRKIARRDLPTAIALGDTGGTTVGATAHVARLVGVDVFATGGIGGVHPGAAQSFDVSGDLAVLASTPIVVVCSGAKSLLDLPATVELLETLGVVTLGYQSDAFPAFYRGVSNLPVQRRIETAATAATIFRAGRALGLSGATLVTVPPPDALPPDPLDHALAAAEADAQTRGIRGGERTPFVLAAVADATDGQSVRVNLALLENNARIAAAIALKLAAPSRAG